MSLSEYVRAMGRGPSRARSLEMDEAKDAFARILAGTEAPEAVGALLMLMRYRGETAGEIAGFTLAARDHMGAWQGTGAALDWPSYAAGRSRGLPWFLLSAKLVAGAGYPVLLHGWNSHQQSTANVRDALDGLSIPTAGSPDCAATALARDGIAYAPLEALSPDLLRILRLRDVLGLRSCVNTVCRMLNPAHAKTMVQGVFHPSYRELQQDAGALLEQRNLMVLKGGGGEFECHPAKPVALYGLSRGIPFQTSASVRIDAHRKLADLSNQREDSAALWRGELAEPWAEAVVTGTAAAALLALEAAEDMAAADDLAQALWNNRNPSLAA
ncbi:MAG: glycosyl transferase family protein [Pseudomonadota bacterium]